MNNNQIENYLNEQAEIEDLAVEQIEEQQAYTDAATKEAISNLELIDETQPIGDSDVEVDEEETPEGFEETEEEDGDFEEEEEEEYDEEEEEESEKED